MPLRPLTELDLPVVRAWRNSPEVRASSYSRHIITEAEHASWFASLRDNPRVRAYVYMDNEGVPSGVVSFTDYRPEAGSSHWGFYAAPGAPRGTGTGLAVCALDEAFDRLGLHKLNAEVLSNNGQSIRFHEKLGFRREGLFRENFFDGAAYIDVVRFGLTDREWRAGRAAIVRS
jgi:UDP-4-amino-4,6-dideoxy-N-acetyl-beta-L-altrosamine N-acetyltransferase